MNIILNCNYYTLSVVILAFCGFAFHCIRRGRWISLVVHPFPCMCLIMAMAFRKPTGIPGMKEFTDQMIALGWIVYCLGFWFCSRTVTENGMSRFWTGFSEKLLPKRDSAVQNNTLFVATLVFAWIYIAAFWLYGWYCTGDILKSICAGHRLAVSLETRLQLIPSLLRYANMLTGYIAPILTVCYTIDSFRRKTVPNKTVALVFLYTTLFFLTASVGCTGSRTLVLNMWIVSFFLVVICLYRRIELRRIAFIFIPVYLLFVSFFAFALVPQVRLHGVESLKHVSLTSDGIAKLYKIGFGYAATPHQRKNTEVKVVVAMPLDSKPATATAVVPDTPTPEFQDEDDLDQGIQQNSWQGKALIMTDNEVLSTTEKTRPEKQPSIETAAVEKTATMEKPATVKKSATMDKPVAAEKPVATRKPFWTFNKETKEHSIRLSNNSTVIIDEKYMHRCSRATTADVTAWVLLFYGSFKEHTGPLHPLYCVATCLVPRYLWHDKPVGAGPRYTADYANIPLKKVGGGPIAGSFGEGYLYWGFTGGILYSILLGILGGLISKFVVTLFLKAEWQMLTMAYSLMLYYRIGKLGYSDGLDTTYNIIIASAAFFLFAITVRFLGTAMEKVSTNSRASR